MSTSCFGVGREGRRERGENQKHGRHIYTCIRISMQAYKWQMYTVHTNIKMVYTVYGLYNMNNGYNRERTFKYCSFVGKQCPCEVTIARVSRAMKQNYVDGGNDFHSG